MLSYRVMLDVPFQLAVPVPGLLAGRRREIGTRNGTRVLTESGCGAALIRAPVADLASLANGFA